MMKKELENFIIESDIQLDYFEEVVEHIAENEKRILDFFKLERLPNKIKILILSYKPFKEIIISKYGEILNYVRGNSSSETNTIIVLNIEDQIKYTIHKDADIKSLKDLLKYDITMAIGQIDTVPAGQYAKESLEKLNIFNEIKDKLVYGKDVSAVKNYVETSEVDLGIVYKSDSLDLKSSQVVLEIPKNLHENINYTLAPINSSEDGKKIIEFINSKYSKKILREYGFLINE